MNATPRSSIPTVRQTAPCNRPVQRLSRGARRVAGSLLRFGMLTGAMLLLVAAIAIAEGAVLWWAGIACWPQTSLTHLSVAELSVSADGRWGASRVRFQRDGKWEETTVQTELLFHDLRRPEHTVRLNVDGRAPQTVAIAPGGDLVAFTSLDQSVFVWSRWAKDRPLRLLGRIPQAGFMELVWSPDGRRIAAAATKHIYLWDMPSGVLRRPIKHGCRGRVWLSFTADSAGLYSAGDGAETQLWDAPSGQLRKTLGRAPAFMYDVAWSPSARQAAILTWRGALHLHDLASGQETWRSAPAQSCEGGAALSPDAAWLAAATCHDGLGRIELWNIRAGEITGELAGHASPLNGLCFTSSGALYSWDSQGVICGWNLESRQPIWRFSCAEWVASHR